MHPILFTIFGFSVRSYSVLIAVAFLVALKRATNVAVHRMKAEPAGSPRRIHPDAVFDISFVGFLMGIVGARVLFVLMALPYYSHHVVEMFQIWYGGLSLHGGLLFGILAVAVMCRIRRVSFFAFGDLFAPSFALGYSLGRLGCFMNGCCYGGVCNLPWGVRFPDENRPGMLTPPSHPTQLYAILFNLIFFAILVQWEKRPHRDGDLFWGYIGMYGFYRMIDEIFRAGATSTYLVPSMHLTDVHIVSAAMMIASAAGLLWKRNRARPEATSVK